MKITKKIFAAAAALLAMGAFSFAQEVELQPEQEQHPEVAASGAKFSFTNELSSDIVYINSVNHNCPTCGDDDGNLVLGPDEVAFAGVCEEVIFKFDSERVDAGVDLKMKLSPAKFINGLNWSGSDHIALGWEADDLDYWLEFRPFKILTLAYHDNVYMRGAYLPVADKDIGPGNLGSDGFTVFVRPIDGLRIAASVPFEIYDYNFINGSDPEDNPFTFGVGADYTYSDFFSVGVAAHDVIDGDEITIGGYGLIRPTKARNLTICFGFAHTQTSKDGINDTNWVDPASASPHMIVINKLDHRHNRGAAIWGQDVYNASIDYADGKLTLAAEIAGNIAPKNLTYDMYIGMLFGYQFTDAFGFEVRERILFDLDDKKGTDNDTIVDVTPKFFYTYKKHQFSAGVDMEFCGANLYFAFPVSWKYTL